MLALESIKVFWASDLVVRAKLKRRKHKRIPHSIHFSNFRFHPIHTLLRSIPIQTFQFQCGWELRGDDHDKGHLELERKGDHLLYF